MRYHLEIACGFHPVEIVDPVSLDQIDEEYNAAQYPGDGVGPGNGGQLIYELHGNGNVGHTNQTPAGEHGKHGDGGFACASHHTG